MALSRRSALGRLAVGAVALVAGKAKADAPWERPELCALRCCGTCRFLEDFSSVIGNSDDGTRLEVPMFGWCSKIGKAPEKPPPKGTVWFGSAFKSTWNRHFLQTCKAHKFNKDAKHKENDIG